MRPFLKIGFLAAAVITWGIFLYFDSLWTDCLTQAVKEGYYREIYGPLTFFRPVAKYAALSLPLVCGVWLAIEARPKAK